MKRIYKNIISLILLISLIIISLNYKDNYKMASSNFINDGPIYRVGTEEKVISLTFDINWAENDELISILELLNKYNVKATFFIMGGWVNYSEDNRMKLIKIKEGGHEIANHSYIHPMFTKITKERVRSELEKTDTIIENTIGVKTSLFRFPSGDYNKEVYDYVTSLGYTCIQWDVDSVDYKEKSAEAEYHRVMKGIKPGSILLFHNNAKYTPENLNKIIREIKDQGYELVTVGEMIYKENFYVNESGEQRKK